MTLTLHLCKVAFMPGYDVWMHHSESVHQTTSVEEENDRTGDNMMDEIPYSIRSELEPTLRIFLHQRFKSFSIFLELQKSHCMNT
jgi:hypothetical protein